MAELRSSDDSSGFEAKAASWLARRDRGLTPAEQDTYLQWLREDPRHGAAVARLEKAWDALDALADCRPAHAEAQPPDPDVLAPPPRGRGRPKQERRGEHPNQDARRYQKVDGDLRAPSLAQRGLNAPGGRVPPRSDERRPAGWLRFGLVGSTLAAAASIAGFFLLRPEGADSAKTAQPTTLVSQPIALAPGVRVIPGAQRLALTDGSDVDLNGGGRIEAVFTVAERRVRLESGEAHFTVAKNPSRPFVVDAGTIAVRAVGTAFDVRRSAGTVEVLVTEGAVELERGLGRDAARSVPRTLLRAGQRATVDASSDVPPDVATVTPAEIERALAWRSVQLEFPELPLDDVVAEFNRRNRQQLRVDDAATAQVRVAGRFRADNVEGFVRLLEASFGISAERSGDGVIVLRRVR